MSPECSNIANLSIAILQIPQGDESCNDANMVAEDEKALSKIRAWMSAVLQSTGMTPSGWARKAGLTPTTVTRHINPKPGHIPSVPSTKTLSKLAKAGGVSLPDMLNPLSVGTAPSQTIAPNTPFQILHFSHNVPVKGVVKAGAWAEMTNDMGEHAGAVPYLDRSLIGVNLIGFVVEGPSMNKVFPEGGTLICATIDERPAVENDFVIVRQVEGRFCEISCKQVVIGANNGIELWPRSDDARHQTPLTEVTRRYGGGDGWEIIAVVENCLPPPLKHTGRPLPLADQPKRNGSNG